MVPFHDIQLLEAGLVFFHVEAHELQFVQRAVVAAVVEWVEPPPLHQIEAGSQFF